MLQEHISQAPSPAQVCAGVDLGGTKIAVILGTSDGNILAHGKLNTLSAAGPAAACERVAELLERLARESTVQLDAIGVGLPGLVDPDAGIIEFLPNLPNDWCGFPAGAFLHRRTGKQVYLLNDARLAALGEYRFGTPAQNMLVVTVGTGIGGGLILDGRLRLGVWGAAGEIGHQTILPEGAPCSCGGRGCLETLINGPMLSAEGAALARSGDAPMLAAIVENCWAAITPKEMALAAKQGDQRVADVIEKAAGYLGIGIANAITLTAVERVVISGGLAALGELLLGPVRAAVRERVRMFPTDCVRITCSTLDDQAGAFGALALAFQNNIEIHSVRHERTHHAASVLL
jgi:glucokinase